MTDKKNTCPQISGPYERSECSPVEKPKISIQMTLEEIMNAFSEEQILNIVLHWYTSGMFEPILQDEDGRDLEEIIEQKLNTINNNT